MDWDPWFLPKQKIFSSLIIEVTLKCYCFYVFYLDKCLVSIPSPRCVLSGCIVCSNTELGEKCDLKDCIVGASRNIISLSKYRILFQKVTYRIIDFCKILSALAHTAM